MNSEYGQRLSLQELKQRNTQQAVLPTLTTPHEACPSKTDWEQMMNDLDALWYHANRQTDLLESVSRQMERIRDKANAERYDRMIAKREEQITEAKKQIEELQNISEMLRSRQAKLKRDISLIDDILREGKMSEAHLRMLVEKILVHEEDGRLDLEIRLKAPFRDHLDIFENGAQTDCFPSADFDYDRLGAAIYGDYYAG